MLKNWMTTVPGILALATVFWHSWQTKSINWEELQSALIAVGLIAAKDWNVTGGDR